jgi:SAM-dependent methyltransferase
VVWEVLSAGLAERSAQTGTGELAVVDLGGGTGGFAVPLARLGHRVTVVDPSPDALAALQRRADEAGVSERVRAVQGDLGSVFEVVEPESADAVLCHGVLEVADDPAEGMRAAAQVLREGGIASVLAANRDALVVARALGGNVAGALAALREPVRRRFTEDALVELVRQAGLVVGARHGVRLFADLVPGAEADDPDLLALEALTAARPEFRALATQVHVLAARPR